MRPQAGWAFAVLVLVLTAGTSMYKDIVPGVRTAPGFTLFAVEASGTREPVAHFDGRRWLPPCDAGAAAQSMAPLERDVVAIEATRDTPLFPVHELARDAFHWEAAWKAVSVDLPADVRAEWVSEAHVYTVQDQAPSTAFVTVSFRRAADLWRGVAINGWVALEASGARRLDARSHPFASYDEYLALERLAPLGVVHDVVTDARIWVMRTTGVQPQEIRVVELADGVRELMRVQRGGCN